MKGKQINKRKLTALLIPPIFLGLAAFTDSSHSLEKTSKAWSDARIRQAEELFASSKNKSVQELRAEEKVRWEAGYPACVERVKQSPPMQIGQMIIPQADEIEISCNYRAAVFALPQNTLESYFAGIVGALKVNADLINVLILSIPISLLIIYFMPWLVCSIPRAYTIFVRWLHT